jgi:hypothetical protein
MTHARDIGQLRSAIALLCGTLLMLQAGCLHAKSTEPTVIRTLSTTPRVVQELAVGGGIACRVDTKVGPVTYLVSDLGKPGTSALSIDDAAMLRQLMRYVHPKTLRFGYLAPGSLIIFDAAYGPCWPAVGGYFVLNRACNQYYAPTENLHGFTAGAGGCLMAPRPWIPGDGGRTDGSTPWSEYDNGH